MKPNKPHDENTRKPNEREAVANVARAQAEGIYSNEGASTKTNPYMRTHETTNNITTQDIETYHSAWQDYYQKYYDGYYKHYSKNSSLDQESTNGELIASDNEKIKLIRSTIRNRIRSSSKKVRHSRHFKPLLIGLTIFMLVLVLQYGRVAAANFYAYVSPGAINPQNIVVSPLSDLSVSNDPKLIIPKINVDAPVIYDIGNDYDSQMAAMSKGLAHFAVPGASSHPGERGNTVISGHSSNSVFDQGDYKFIFAGLDKLSVGDVIYAHYKGVRYTYAVTKKEVVEPTEVSKLIYETNKPVLTLITCTPLGTDRFRLLVTAEQVSPDPAKASESSQTNNKSLEMPGSSPTFFQWLIGLFTGQA